MSDQLSSLTLIADMQISHRIENNIYIVTLKGDLVLAKLQQVKRYIEPLLADSLLRGLILDAEHVRSLDSSGLSLLVYLANLLAVQRKQVALVRLHPNHLQLLQNANLSEQFLLADTLSNALWLLLS